MTNYDAWKTRADDDDDYCEECGCAVHAPRYCREEHLETCSHYQPYDPDAAREARDEMKEDDRGF